MAWPENIEFIFSPFVVVAMLDKKKYAEIEFGEYGNPIRIDLYQEGLVCRRNIYDDRGFVSGTIVYEKGEPVYQDYLMENGVRKFRLFFSDGHCEINPEYSSYLIVYGDEEHEIPFIRQRYERLDDMILEVAASYIGLTDENDMFCVAVHENHIEMIDGILEGRNVILSFFKERYSFEKTQKLVKLIENVGYIITDSQSSSMHLRQLVNHEIDHIQDITPYDARVDFGISSQLTVQNILVPVDDLPDKAFASIVTFLAAYLRKNRNARVHLFTRNAESDRISKILEKAEKYLGEKGMDSESFSVDQCVNELSVSRCMREQRILLDLRMTPELYLQITAISMGIPQIVRTGTQFLEDGKNGRILKNIRDLHEVLDYYLDGLNNWNEAVIHAYEKGRQFSTERILEKWKEVIDFFG
jgi:accessory secretory protein Asp1